MTKEQRQKEIDSLTADIAILDAAMRIAYNRIAPSKTYKAMARLKLSWSVELNSLLLAESLDK